MKRIRIAIDGPAASGKSTVARKVAEKLCFSYIDTGAMYRALALKIQMRNVDPSDTVSLRREILDKTSFSICNNELLIDNNPLDSRIRTEEISRLSSMIAQIPEVRAYMKKEQRKLAKDGRVVMEGRDIGTVILPDAEIKIFLTASPEERTRRRVTQLKLMGQEAEEAQIMREIQQRDLNDSTRDLAPLRPAPDAINIDTTHMSIDEIVDDIVERVSAE
ncbi:MAG: Cytidylate kinase [Thermotogales bacterium 46_20]|nr:MAG: Cytidylate kinase [Thermotogales bacterium 46_20]